MTKDKISAALYGAGVVVFLAAFADLGSGVTFVLYGILCGAVAMYVSCLCYLVTVRREHKETTDLLLGELDDYDEMLADAQDAAATTHASDHGKLFHNALEIIEQADTPETINDLLVCYKALERAKDRRINSAAEQRLTELCQDFEADFSEQMLGKLPETATPAT